jgi:hypothetical protein
MSRCYLPLALAAVLAMSFGGAASAGMVDASFHAHMSIDGVPYELPVVIDENTGYGIVDWYIEGAGDDGYTCQLYVSMNPDPEVTYAISVLDFGAPSVFSFSFGQTIVPIGNPNQVAASIGGTLSDGTGDGVQIVPTAVDIDGDLLPEVAVAYLGPPTTNMGVDVGLGTPVLVGNPLGIDYTWGDYSDFNPLGVTAPLGGWTTLDVDVGFSLLGGGDGAVLTGRASIEGTIIPEPSSMLLAGLGAVGLVVLRLRRRVR